MNRVLVLAVPALVLSASVAAAEMAAPPNLVTINAAGTVVDLWPYTYQVPAAPGVASDPVNLVFLNSDPRGIRQALLQLAPSRPYPPPLGGTCRWSDAMGNEQASYADGDWSGSEVQLACTDEGLPLGNPFRTHLRLFRHGSVTLGAAHFEVLITGTAQHEVLSWDFARDFVKNDMLRTGTLGATPVSVPVTSAPSFRAVRFPIWDPLVKSPAVAVLAYLGLYPHSGTGDVPIPTTGEAIVLAPAITLQPEQAKTELAYEVNYAVLSPKPFCNTPADYVQLSGPVRFQMRVHTNPSGKYERTYQVSGTLTVVPLTFTPGTGLVPGQPLAAEVSEFHRALLTDHYGQVTEQTTQTLLSEVPQSQFASLSAGHVDEAVVSTVCSLP